MKKISIPLVTVAVGLLCGTADGASKSYSNATITSSYYDIDGPYMAAYSYTWSQYITPTIVGTIEVIINTDTNRTSRTTKTNTEFSTNGTVSILTRTDTNAAGTVTDVVHDQFGSTITAYVGQYSHPLKWTCSSSTHLTRFDPENDSTYPSPVLELASRLTWDAILPTSFNGSICCYGQSTYSVTPTHTPFASPTGSTDSADPSGWLYTLYGVDYGDGAIELGPSNISSLWSGQSIGIPYTGCGHTYCNTYATSAAGAFAVGTQAYLFATSTILTSGLDSAASHSTTSTAPHTSSFEVDPITQSSESVPSTTEAAISKSPASSPTPVFTPAQSASQISESDPSPASATATPSATIADPSKATPTLPSTQSSQETQSATSDAAKEPSHTQSSSNVPLPTSQVVSSEQATPSEPAVTSKTAVPQVSDSSQQIESSQPTVVAGGETGSLNSNPAAIPQTAVPSETAVSQGSGSSQQLQHSQSTVINGGGTDSLNSNPTVVSRPATSATSGDIGALIASAIGLVKTTSTPANEATGGATTASPEIASSAPAPIVVGAATISLDSLSNLIISGQPLTPGSSIVLGSGISTTVVVLSTGSSETVLHVGESVLTINAPSAPSIMDSAASTVNAATGLFAGASETASQVGLSTPTTKASPEVATTTHALPIVVGDNTIVPDKSSQYIVSGHTLVPGSSITLGSGPSTTVVALFTGPSETVLQIGSSTSTISATPSVNETPILSAAISSLAANPTALASVLSSLAANPTATILPALSSALSSLEANPTSSLAPDAISSILSLVVANSASVAGAESSNIPIIVGSRTINPDASSVYIVSGQTLTPGSSITIGSGSSATILALQTSGSQTYLIVGSSTSTLSQQQPETATPVASTALPPAFTLGSSVVLPNSASEYIFGSQTLRPGGPAITISGSVVSLASGATELVVGTESLKITPQTGTGIGSIWSETEGGTTKTPSGVTTSSSTARVTTESTATPTSAAQTTSASNGVARQKQRSRLEVSGLIFFSFMLGF